MSTRANAGSIVPAHGPGIFTHQLGELPITFTKQQTDETFEGTRYWPK